MDGWWWMVVGFMVGGWMGLWVVDGWMGLWVVFGFMGGRWGSMGITQPTSVAFTRGSQTFWVRDPFCESK